MNKILHIIYGLLLPVIACCMLGTPQILCAQSVQLRGVVVDSVSGEPVPYVAISLTGTPVGTLTDDHGRFNIHSYVHRDSIRASVIGYRTQTVPVPADRHSIVEIKLAPTGVQLAEVVVKPKKEKYSKKNNPAVDFMERIRHTQALNNPRRHDYYNYDKYERITIAINDYKVKENNWIDRKFSFIKDHVDTSEISGKPILPISIREKKSTVNFRRTPMSEHEHVRGSNTTGLDDNLTNQEGVREILEDVFREIDIYSNDITLLQNRFVSPLSRMAADFYKFYLSDTMVVDQDTCVVLSFVPHTPTTWGFIGKLYVPKGDSTMFIKKIDMYMPHSINVNYVDAMTLSQTFKKDADGTRLKTKDDMVMELSVLPGMPKLYIRRNTLYDEFNYVASADSSVYDYDQYEIFAPDAQSKTAEFWSNERLAPLNPKESSVGEMADKIRKVPLYYWTERTFKLLFTGYVKTGNPSKFDYGPINTSVSYSSIGGIRLRAGGMTTANLSKRWFGRGFVAYGLRDHRLKYRGEVEYSFIDKKYHAREFPVKSLRFTSTYDLDALGQRYLATNDDNFFLSLKRKNAGSDRSTYRRMQELRYTLELTNNFSVEAAAVYERQESTKHVPFITGYGQRLSHYTQTSFELMLRYAPGEKFYQGRSERLPINMDAPVIELQHIYSPRGLLNSRFTINCTELRYTQRLWLSAFGYIDMIVKGGHVWSRVPYMDLLLPNANLTYIIQPESYALLNSMEFMNDTYASIDMTYWLNGLILNRIPLISKAKMREVIGFKALWGHLSDRNDPAKNPALFVVPEEYQTTRMTGRPYMEFSVGLDNIFRILRVEYVTRLSYRNPVNGAPNQGVRVAMHLSF